VEDVHFLLIWLVPERVGLAPGYEQRALDVDARAGEWLLAASRDGREGSITVHQDVSLWAARLPAGAKLSHALAPGRHAWLQVARGAVSVNGGAAALAAGDGLAASDERSLAIAAGEPSELLLFDLA
jgi:redox-sensitive bicupin YhaK (pirin superfamily)